MDEEHQEVPLDQEAVDNYEDTQEFTENQLDTYDQVNFPTQRGESNIYNLFWKVNKAKSSTKVGNLKKDELGMLNISVRDAQKLGTLGHIFHHPLFGDFFFGLAEITSSTSMARDGWFAELFVSQKKFTTRARKSSSQVNKGWRMFQKSKTSEETNLQ